MAQKNYHCASIKTGNGNRIRNKWLLISAGSNFSDLL